MGGGFGALIVRMDGGFYAVNNEIVDAVLDVGRCVFRVEKATIVGFVLGKQQIGGTLAVEPARAVIVMIQLDRRDFRGRVAPKSWLTLVETPGPGVAKPDGGQKMKRRGVGAAVYCLDADQNIVRAGLGIFDEDIEIAVVVKD